ncbi:MAG TPA: transglycosylase domain-containing protein [Thermoflexales bacterium]|jgi:penicillin-binding protein 1C|nr:transglycosylase domain-containing protein [Thermoflexales bacterium]
MHGHRRVGLWVKRIAIGTAVLGAVSVFGLLITLPSVEALPDRIHVASTRFLDRNGVLLYEVVDPQLASGGRRTHLALADMGGDLRRAVIAVEDASFYENPGVDLRGIARSLLINLEGGETLAGGSTLTQQLARLTLLDETERQQRTLLRKAREALLALQLGARYPKDAILAFYLNEAYFGNLAYGAEAAAQAYFGKRARELDLAQSALLAGLLQNPVAYDPLNHPEAAHKRQGVVLDLMMRQRMISEEQALAARQTRLEFAGSASSIRAPHMVAYARAWAEERFGVEAVSRGGLVITTTLDIGLNDIATRAARDRLGQLRDEQVTEQRPYGYNANNAAVVVLDPRSGDILAMVGSPDYFDRAISGAVNAAVALRQPGSAIKPLTYAAAFERVPGFTAATPIIDVERPFPTREGLPYVPENYDRRHVGPISARAALATSNNVAAVATLEQLGVSNMLAFGRALGLRSLGDESEYGLSLTLGGGEVRLLELAASFGAFARAGVPLEPAAVLQVSDAAGRVIYQRSPAIGQPAQMSPSTAWLIGDILSDNAARAPAFGEHSALRLPFQAAAKTGTTTDWRDNWTVGYTPRAIVGVWVGNATGESMTRISGVTGAAPIWRDVMLAAHENQRPGWFERPADLTRVEICALSGMLPTPSCPARRTEWFVYGTAPTRPDTWTARIGGITVFRLPDLAQDWARAQGWTLADEADAAGSSLRLTRPFDGAQYRLSSELPADAQRMMLEMTAPGLAVHRAEYSINGDIVPALDSAPYAGLWTLRPGSHTVVGRIWLADGRMIETAAARFVVLP